MKTKITLLIVVTFACAAQVFGQTYVNLAATGGNDGTTWADAYTDLTTALSSSTTGDEIWIAQGTYTPSDIELDTSNTFEVVVPISIYGGFVGTETALTDRIDGNETILSGDIAGNDVPGTLSNREDNIFHVMTVDTDLEVGSVVIDGITVSGGNTRAIGNGTDLSWRGGGIYAFSQIQVSNSVFRDNFARGGACIYLSPNGLGASGSSVTGCTFISNRSNSQSAGILANEVADVSVIDCEFRENATVRGAFYPLRCTNLLVEGCQFTDNISGSDNFGGALFIWSSRGVVRNCTFSGNRAGNAGAIYFDGRDDTIGKDNMLFEDCTFGDNGSSGFGGGMMYAFRSSYTMRGCTLTNNISGNSGGAIFNTGGNMDVEIADSYFSGNEANFGGASTNYGIGSSYQYTNVTFQGNNCVTSGGATINGFGASSTYTDCTFDANTANFGGAMYAQNDTTIVNLVSSRFIANNAGGTGGAVNISSPIQASIDSCYFESNSADIGGAISVTGSNDGEFGEGRLLLFNSILQENVANTQGAGLNVFAMETQIINSVIAGNVNTGDGAGGGISINSDDSLSILCNIVNSTIADNFAFLGAGMSGFTTENMSGLEVRIANSIFANDGTNYEIEDGTPLITSFGGNLSTDETMSDILTGTNDQTEVDIEEVMFVDNSQLDYQLLPGSPAINIGDADIAPLTDILGNPRVGAPDAGAYESDVTSTLDIETNDGQLTMSPNPVQVSSTITLDNPWTGEIELQILDVEGKIVLTKMINKISRAQSVDVDMTTLVAGTYYMTAINSRMGVVLPFVKM